MTSQTLSLLFCFRIYHKINGIGKFICQNVWIFFFPLLACQTCWSHIGAVSEKWEKKKKRKKRDTLLRHRSLASRAGSDVRHVSNISTSPKMACRCNLGCNLYFIVDIIWSYSVVFPSTLEGFLRKIWCSCIVVFMWCKLKFFVSIILLLLSSYIF